MLAGNNESGKLPMAIPPLDVLNSCNVNLTLRAAELGWVSKRKAVKAVNYTHLMASKGEFTDALEVLAKNEGLSQESVYRICRDENAQKRWWQFWKHYHGPDGVWGATIQELLNAMYGKNRGGCLPEHRERAKKELQRRAFENSNQLLEILRTMKEYKRPNNIQITPDPIKYCLDRWQRMGLKFPGNFNVESSSKLG